MKTMKCSDMGGPCDTAMTAATPMEMMKMGGDHVNDMAAKGDAAHIEVKKQMDGAMTDPAAMKAWETEFHAGYEKAPEAK